MENLTAYRGGNSIIDSGVLDHAHIQVTVFGPREHKFGTSVM